jgi:hypothetical protein
MPLPQTRLDPEGYYARLGVVPSASTDEIAAAFRRKARALHPDVPITGDTDAFVAARKAHDVLTNPNLRAAYDRAARRAWLDTQEVGEIPPDPQPIMATVPTRHPRLSDLPMGLWAAAAIVICFGLLEAVLHLSGVVGQTAKPTRPEPPALAASQPNPRVDPAPSSPPPSHWTTGSLQSGAQAAPMQLAGTPNFYIIPAAGPTVLWHHDAEHNAFVPVGQLPPFTAVQALRLLRQNGLMEVQVTDSTTGLVEASRLSPGDTSAARRAYCAYNAGAFPNNGEVLERHGRGNETLEVTNRSAQPAVVKLRDAAGGVVVSVFLAPGGHVEVAGLQPGRYRPDYAIGEMWSRACNGFAAGMRAQRFADLAPLSQLNPLAVPLDASGDRQAADISDSSFEGD